ncbi:protein of unknown function (plasmid) [Azospirillum baldaniorum]|uniref:Tape measure protein N-terminal domain-containing protein n=1 Tax=Azospirillum baldaniorum TaxID=1064539 RepID=A0A9P1JY72_9PROT|nr:protein of unknown function [Azospirillum baldaniorum]
MDDASFRTALSRVVADVGKLKTETEKADGAVDDLGTSAGSAFGGMKTALAGLVAGIGFGSLISNVVGTIRSFEDLRGQLNTLTGSAEKGADAFKMITQFTASTPFELEDVTKAFARLKTVGIDPTESTLKNLGNVAASFGKDFTQFAEAVADATTGEFERLKEFGILMGKQGNEVTVTFDGVTQKIFASATSIRSYLEGLGKTKFASGIENQAATVSGAFSNVADSFKLLAYEIGEAGFRQALNDVARDLSKFLGDNKNLAREIGSSLASATRTAADLFKIFANNIDLVVVGLKSLVAAGVAAALGGIVIQVRNLIAGFTTLNALVSKNPLVMLAMTAGLVAAGYQLMGDNIDTTTEALKRSEAIMKSMGAANIPLDDQLANARQQADLFQQDIIKLQNTLNDRSWLDKLNPFDSDGDTERRLAEVTANYEAWKQVIAQVTEQIKQQKAAQDQANQSSDQDKILREQNVAAMTEWLTKAKETHAALLLEYEATVEGVQVTDAYRQAKALAAQSVYGVNSALVEEATALALNNSQMQAAIDQQKKLSEEKKQAEQRVKGFKESLQEQVATLQAEVATFGQSMVAQEAYKLAQQAQKLGISEVTAELRNKITALQEEKMAMETNKSIASYIDNLKTEASLLRMGNQEREVARNLREAENIAKAGGRALTQAEIDDIRRASVLKQEAAIENERREQRAQELTRQSSEAERQRQLEIERSVELQIRAEEQLRQSLQRVGDTIADMVEKGKFSLRTLIAEFIRLIATQVIARSAIAGGNGGFLGGLATGAIRGLRAGGGNVMAGSSYVVGEQGAGDLHPDVVRFHHAEQPVGVGRRRVHVGDFRPKHHGQRRSGLERVRHSGTPEVRDGRSDEHFPSNADRRAALWRGSCLIPTPTSRRPRGALSPLPPGSNSSNTATGTSRSPATASTLWTGR